MRLSWVAEEGGIHMSEVWEQDVRRTDRLRGVRLDGGQQSTLGQEVSRKPRSVGMDCCVGLLTVGWGSFWFLFPVANFGILPIPAPAEQDDLAPTCFGCDKLFPPVHKLCILRDLS